MNIKRIVPLLLLIIGHSIFAGNYNWQNNWQNFKGRLNTAYNYAAQPFRNIKANQQKESEKYNNFLKAKQKRIEDAPMRAARNDKIKGLNKLTEYKIDSSKHAIETNKRWKLDSFSDLEDAQQDIDLQNKFPQQNYNKTYDIVGREKAAIIKAKEKIKQEKEKIKFLYESNNANTAELYRKNNKGLETITPYKRKRLFDMFNSFNN